MTHKIVNAGDRMFCTLCGEEGTTGFSAVCAPAKVELDAAAAQENKRLDAAAARENKRLDAAATQENKRLSVCILVCLIVLGVTVFFSHGVARFSDKTVAKLATAISDGFTKAQDGLKYVAAAVGGGNIALIGPHSFFGEWVRPFASGCFKIARGIWTRTG